jgi:16S rRNA (cytosine1402-N4)-methyltransferase
MVSHKPVLYQEILDVLRPHAGGIYVDGTVGAGGHAWGILEASSPDGKLIGFDLDPQALEIAREKLAPFGDRFVLVHASYTKLTEQLVALGVDSVDGILLDLGLSSMQLAAADRGFSFQEDGPLDMRFDPEAKTSAADLVNRLPENELADLIYQYGEERYARRIAAAIVAARSVDTTAELADLVAKAVPGGRKRIHPATRTFQALRIAVNDELASVEAVLPQAVDDLKAGGRLAVIAFHSLEDRIVKRYFRRQSRDCICPPESPICTCEHQATIKEITRKPIRPTEAETRSNPRARSARLRVAEKLDLR